MAKGLKEANEKLDAMNLPEKERKAYDKYLRRLENIPRVASAVKL